MTYEKYKPRFLWEGDAEPGSNRIKNPSYQLIALRRALVALARDFDMGPEEFRRLSDLTGLRLIELAELFNFVFNRAYGAEEIARFRADPSARNWRRVPPEIAILMRLLQGVEGVFVTRREAARLFAENAGRRRIVGSKPGASGQAATPDPAPASRKRGRPRKNG